MSTTKKLRLGPLRKTESVKLTFACPASLKADLERYASLHAQVYGEAVDTARLIPHMLEAFMAGIGDQERQRGQGRAAQAKLTMRGSSGDYPSNAQLEAARSSFWRMVARWAMMKSTSPPLLGNPARPGTIRLSLPTLLCDS